MALNIDQSLARAWRYAWANALQLAPSWGFVTRLLAADDQALACRALAPSSSLLFRAGLISLCAAREETPLSERSLSLAPEALAVLVGWEIKHDAWQTFDQLRLPPARSSRASRR